MWSHHFLVFLLCLLFTSLAEAASPWDCNFEDNQCRYSSLATGKRGEWNRMQTSKDGTGTVDHTFGQSGKGWFMETEMNDTETGEATLQATTKLDSNSVHCLSFYIYQTGYRLQTLKVMAGNDVLLEKTGDNENALVTWHRIEVEIPEKNTKRALSFVADKKHKGLGYIALDDIVVSHGSCKPLGVDCDFEVGLCEWHNNNTQMFQWKRTNQVSSSINTGPYRDHTTGFGYFIYAISDNRSMESGAFATLNSGLLQLRKEVPEGCLTFWYYMYGDGMPKLFVYVDQDQKEELVFSSSKSDRSVWLKGYAQIKTTGLFQVKFLASLSNYLGDVALDDVQLSTNACPAIPKCDFESGFCGFHSTSKAWKIRKGSRQFNFVDRKHNLNTEIGHSLALNLSGQSSNTKAILISPVYHKRQSKMCLSFAYYHRDFTQSLQLDVYMKSKQDKGNGLKIWNWKHKVGVWDYVQQTITPKTDYQIIFEGTSVGSSKHLLYIDDFVIQAGECPSLGSCNFEESYCGYASYSESHFTKWERNSGYFLIKSNGPPVDHTTKTQEGFYMMASNLKDDSETGVFALQSPELPRSKSRQACVSFWFYKADEAELLVAVMQPLSFKILFKTRDFMGERWNYKALTIPTFYDYTVMFYASKMKKGESHIAIDDIVFTDGDCSQRKSPTFVPQLPKSYPPTKFDCNFDQGNACNWKMNQGSNAKLSVVKGKTSDYVDEPFDHTQENTQGQFLSFLPNVTTGTIGKHTTSTASLISPPLEDYSLANGTCLKFWYLMEDSAIGHLTVVLKKASIAQSETVWRKDGVTESGWTLAQIYLGSSTLSVKSPGDVMFEIQFSTLYRPHAVFKIDDIALNDGPCLEKLQHCDFEDPDICGFIQDSSEFQNWDRFPEKMAQGGPHEDHSYGTAFGHYMYLYNQNGLTKSRLLSPSIDATHGKCLRFYFFMTGGDDIELQVRTLSEEQTEIMVWSRKGSAGPKWRGGQVDINLDTPSKIIFEGFDNNVEEGFIAIDDVSLLDSPCQESGSCNFENDMCLFQNVKNNINILAWQRHSGPVTSSQTGPNVDATTHTKWGHYMYIESSPLHGNGDTAQLASDFLPPTSGSCLSFSYQMFGDSTGQLNVKQDRLLSESILLASIDQKQGSSWEEKFINISSNRHSFSIVFEGKLSSNANSGIALDDIQYSNSPCYKSEKTFICGDGKKINVNQKCNFVAECSDGSDEANCGSCNFEKDLCGYVSTGFKEYNFERGNSFSSSIQVLGKDHTLGSLYGHMIFMNAEIPVGMTNIHLISPLLQKSYQTCHLEFYYKILDHYSTFEVGLQFAHYSWPVPIFMTKSTYNPGVWMQAFAQIGFVSEPFHIVLTGIKRTHDIPFLIDDIILHGCGSPAPAQTKDKDLFTCKSGYQIEKNTVCDLADDCGDQSDELNCQNVHACNFERSFCTWRQDASSKKGLWIRQHGFDPSYNFGPLRDHTTGTPSGHFIYLKKSSSSQETTARLVSPVMKGIQEKNICWLTIFYQMRGLSLGTKLNVYLQTTGNGYMTKIFTKHNQMQNYWDRVVLSVQSAKDFQIIIEGRHSGFEGHSEIGLDDLVLSDGCHFSDPTATLPTPSAPLTMQTTPKNDCPHSSQHQCGDGTCIDERLVCDFNKDCKDGSDEQNCGSCDFEKGWCGWYQVSTGRLSFSRSSQTIMGDLGPSYDTTLGDKDGHYIYATHSTGISSSPLVIQSSSLPSVSRYCLFTFQYLMKSSSHGTVDIIGISEGSRVFIGSMKVQFTRKSLNPYPVWKQAYFQLGDFTNLADGWYLEVIFNYPENFRPSHSAMFALDDMKFEFCSLHYELPSLSCPFHSQDKPLCAWKPNEISDWKIDSVKENMLGPKIAFWDRHCLVAKKSLSTLLSPKLPSFVSTAVCLSFWFYIPESGGKIYVIKNDGFEHLIIFDYRSYGKQKWLKSFVSIKSSFAFSLEIEASTYGNEEILIDEISFSNKSCEHEQEDECTFESNGLCGWTEGSRQGIFWERRNSRGMSRALPPGIDHTTGSVNGRYLYLKVRHSNRGNKATLKGPLISKLHNPGYCFTFWYQIAGSSQPPVLRIYFTQVISKSAVNHQLAVYPGPTDKVWRRGTVDIDYKLSSGRIILVGEGNGGDGFITIDDISVLHGRCPSPGSCPFRYDLCGFINSPSNLYDFVVQRLYPDLAIAEPTSYIKTGDKAVLISDPISKGGCLSFQGYLKSSKSEGLTTQILNVYTRQLSSPGNKTLIKVLNYFVRNHYTPAIKVDLSNNTDFEIVFEVVYHGESLGISSVELDYEPCSSDIATVNLPTTVIPSVPLIHPPSPLDCHFDFNPCNWIQMASSSNWTLSHGSNFTAHTLEHYHIRYDHTLNSKEGGYMQVGSSENLALLLSPKVSMNYSICLQFWYFMYGPKTGNLNVVLNTKKTIWTRKGTQSPQWNFAAIHITGVKEGVISFEAKGSNDSGVIAIDDISSFLGKCPETNGCDFENGDCDYQLKELYYLPWNLTSGALLQHLISPVKGDHTVGTYSGWCLAIEPSLKASESKARFTSTVFSGKEGSCLTFWYYMDGSDKAVLEVYKFNSDTDIENSRIAFAVKGSQGPSWQLGTIEILESANFILTFEGFVGKTKRGSIAVDDIKLVEGKCPSFASCDFEDEFCAWTNTDNNATSEWMYFRGDLLTIKSADHTTGTLFGGYLITDRDCSSIASFTSPTLQRDTYYCLTFWAILNDGSMAINTININGKTLNLIDENHIHMISKHPKNREWKLFQFTINPSPDQFQVVLEGKIATERLYLDDISIHKQKCSNISSAVQRHQQFYCNSSKTWLPSNTMCDFKVDCAGNNEEVICGYDCDFESGSCGWKTEYTSNEGSWLFGSGNSLSSQSYIDHTLQTVKGHFMYSDVRLGETIIVFRSPQLALSSASCELIFSFYIAKQFTGTLSVSKVQGSTVTTLFRINRDKNEDDALEWKTAVVPIGRMANSFHLEIRFNVTSQVVMHETNVLLDDISFRNCKLPSKEDCEAHNALQFTCKNSACINRALMCNSKDDCGDNSDEKDVQCKDYKMWNFEDGSLGYWKQEIGTDEFDWHVYKTRVFADHTTYSGEGHVASAANFMRKNPMDRAHLISPVFSPGSVCMFRLSYMMDYKSKGAFNIYKRNEINGDLTLLQSPEPEGMFRWKTTSSIIGDSKPFQVVLEITAKVSSSIDIDDTIFNAGCKLFNGSFPGVPPKPKPSPKPAKCSSSEFSCTVRGCVPLNQVCDFLPQCPDGSDERHCSTCNFDDGQCQWEDASDGNFKWHDRSTSFSINADPNQDHTRSTSSSFHSYMTVSNDGTEIQAPAVLTSGPIGTTPSDCVVIVWLYVKYPFNTEISLTFKRFNAKRVLREKYLLNSFKAKNLPQGVWTKVESTIGYQSNGGEVIVTASGMKRNTIIALDDVSFSKCAMGVPKDSCANGQMQCKNKACISVTDRCDLHSDCSDKSDELDCSDFHQCDFERSTCDFTFDTTFTTLWTRKTADAVSMDLSPLRDHTTSSRNGHFLEIRGSKHTFTVYARMIGPVIYPKSTRGRECQFRFFYYQKTNTSDSLRIYSQYEEGGPVKRRWSNQHGTNGIWVKVSIPLFDKRPLRIIIEGVSKVRVQSAVAIDDISLTPACFVASEDEILPTTSLNRQQGSCSQGFFQCDGTKCFPNHYICDMKAQCQDGRDEENCGVPCNFETGSCGWTHQYNNENTKISPIEVGKINVPRDHNPGTNNGHVLPALFNKKNISETFISPFWEKSFENCKFSFWYRDSEVTGTQVRYIQRGHREPLMFEKDGSSESLGKWRKISAPLPKCASNFQIEIEVINDGFQTDSSVVEVFDDFSFEDCPKVSFVTHCQSDEFMCKDRLKCIPESLKCDLSSDCCDESDEDSYLCFAYKQFTFDWGMDNWKQETDDEGDWQLSKADDFLSPLDHTSESKSGEYLRFETDSSRFKGKISYSANMPLGDCHMRLWYTGVVKTGETSGILNIYLQSRISFLSKLISVNASSEGWKKIDVPIKVEDTYKIVLESVGGITAPSGISVDDISFTPGCDMGSPTPPPSFVPPTPTPPAVQTGPTTQMACPGQFQCRGNKKCISLSKKCDFNFDCIDESDENECYTNSVCTFSSNTCGWTSSSTVSKIGWIRDTPSGAKKGMAPSYDASFMKGDRGHFMYFSDTLVTGQSGQVATINSRKFNGAAASCEVHFSFFMQGSGAGLRMNIKYQNEKDLIWESKTKSNKWQKAVASVGRRKIPFSLEIVKVLSDVYIGQTAIDNIQFVMCAEQTIVDVCSPADTKYSCHNKVCIERIHLCDGQDDCGDDSDEMTSVCKMYTSNNLDTGFHSMTQAPSGVEDSLDWKLWTRGQIPSIGLQAIDHTTFSSQGKYAYAIGSKPGDSAWLLSSNWVVASASESCEGSVYVMVPSHSSKLSIGIRTHNSGKPDQEMKSIQATGSVWTFVHFIIPTDKPFKIAFMADFKSSGDAVAIDDFVMSPKCKRYYKALPCSPSMFECHSNSKCIDADKKCDGKTDCNDGTDELNCNTKQSSTTSTISTLVPHPSSTNPPPTPRHTGSSQKNGLFTSQSSEKSISASMSPFFWTTNIHLKEQSAASSGEEGSWKIPLGVVLGLALLIVAIVFIVLFLKKKGHLTMRNGFGNPVFDYGSGQKSKTDKDFELSNVNPKHLNSTLADNLILSDNQVAFDNPVFTDESRKDNIPQSSSS